MTDLISAKLQPGTSSWSFFSSVITLGREDVAARRGDLAELDERRPQVLENEPDSLADRDPLLLGLAPLELFARDLGRVRRRIGLFGTAEARAGDDLAETVADEDGRKSPGAGRDREPR